MEKMTMPKMIEEYETGVYCWLNKENGKMYVGGAYDSLHRRHQNYLQRFKRGKCHNRHLQAAWDKYGGWVFEFIVIERCPPEQVEELETYWINALNVTNDEVGYNICLVAKSRLGVQHTAATKELMSIHKKGKQYRLGKTHTQETKDKIAATKRGTKMSQESRDKMSASRTGKKMSPERLANSRKAHWSRGPNAAAIAEKISVGNEGKVLSDETRAKISATKLGK